MPRCFAAGRAGARWAPALAWRVVRRGARRAAAGVRAPPSAFADLGLAVGAYPPLRVERLAAGAARALEAPLAVWAAHELVADRILAVRAGLLDQLADAQLRGTDLEVALAHVIEELRRPQDRVDDGADERKQRRRRGAGDQHRVLEPPLRVEVGPIDQREVDDDEEKDQQVYDDAESRCWRCRRLREAWGGVV